MMWDGSWSKAPEPSPPATGDKGIALKASRTTGIIRRSWEEGCKLATVRNRRSRPDIVYYLPPGEVVHMQPGTAADVMVRLRPKEEWHNFEFTEPGTLEGPLLWVEGACRSSRDLVDEATWNERHSSAYKQRTRATTATLVTFGLAAILLVYFTMDALNWPTQAFFLVCLAGFSPLALTIVRQEVFDRAENAFRARETRDPQEVRDCSRHVTELGTTLSDIKHFAKQFDLTSAHAPETSEAAPAVGEITAAMQRNRQNQAQAGTNLLTFATTMLDEIGDRICASAEIAQIDSVKSTYLEVAERVDAAAQRQDREFVKEEADDIVRALGALSRQLDSHRLTA